MSPVENTVRSVSSLYCFVVAAETPSKWLQGKNATGVHFAVVPEAGTERRSSCTFPGVFPRACRTRLEF